MNKNYFKHYPYLTLYKADLCQLVELFQEHCSRVAIQLDDIVIERPEDISSLEKLSAQTMKVEGNITKLERSEDGNDHDIFLMIGPGGAALTVLASAKKQAETIIEQCTQLFARRKDYGWGLIIALRNNICYLASASALFYPPHKLSFPSSLFPPLLVNFLGIICITLWILYIHHMPLAFLSLDDNSTKRIRRRAMLKGLAGGLVSALVACALGWIIINLFYSTPERILFL